MCVFPIVTLEYMYKLWIKHGKPARISMQAFTSIVGWGLGSGRVLVHIVGTVSTITPSIASVATAGGWGRS